LFLENYHDLNLQVQQKQRVIGQYDFRKMRQDIWRKQHEEVVAMMNAELSNESTVDGKKLIEEHYQELYYDYLNKSNPFTEEEEYSMEELLVDLSELKQVRRKLRAAMQAWQPKSNNVRKH
jgi:hypothetical protein